MRIGRSTLAVFVLLSLATIQAQPAKPSADDLLREAGVAVAAQDFAKAELWVREVITSFPNDPRGSLALLSILERANKTAEGLKFAREIQVRYRTDSDYHVLVGRILLQADRIPDALAEYNIGLQYSQRPAAQAAIYALIGDAHRFQGEWNEALAAYENAKKISGRPYLGLAMTWGQLGNFDEEVREYKAVLALAPQNAAVLNNLAYSYAERGQSLQEALTYAQRAVAIEPGASGVVDTLGWVYFKMGRLEEAERELLRAAAMEAGNQGNILDHLGTVLDARAVWTPERRELRDLLKREPTGRTVARVKELLKAIQ